MTLAGVAGLLLATPLGHLADRAGPREVLIVTLVLQAVGTLAYMQVHSFALFLPVACLRSRSITHPAESATPWSSA